ncbi:MAG TPA: hypothetical protein VIT23_03415 [Terrimicrobiaceae bacterium]
MGHKHGRTKWWKTDADLREVLLLANALLTDLREALAPGRFDPGDTRSIGYLIPVEEALIWATATLEVPKSITREQENLRLMSAIREQCLDIVRQMISENAPRQWTAAAAAALRVWGESLAYWSESPDKFLPLYEEFAASWNRMRSWYPDELSLRFRHPLEFILTALDSWNYGRQRATWNGQRTSWVGFIEPVQAQLAASDDPGKRLAAAWLEWRAETVRVKKDLLAEKFFQRFKAATDEMLADPRLCWSFHTCLADSFANFDWAKPNITVEFHLPGLRTWNSKELIEAVFPIYHKGYENDRPMLDVGTVFWSLRGRWMEEMLSAATHYADRIADPKAREAFKVSLARSVEEIRGDVRAPAAENQDRPAIVLEKPWSRQIELALLPGEQLIKAAFISNFLLKDGRLFFCAKLYLKDRDYRRQPNVLFSVDPRTNETQFWRLPDGPEKNFSEAGVNVSGKTAWVVPRGRDQTDPTVVVMDTGKIHVLPDVRLAALYFDLDDQNGAIFCYKTSGVEGINLLEKTSLGRLDLSTGRFEIIASSRRRPASHLLDGEEWTIHEFAWDGERSRLLVSASHPEGGFESLQRHLEGVRAGDGWKFSLIDRKDPSFKIIQKIRKRPGPMIIGGVRYADITGSGTAIYVKDHWIDFECEIRELKRKKDAPKMALAFDVVDAPDLDDALSKAADKTKIPSMVNIRAADDMGFLLGPHWLSGQGDRLWFVPMEKIEAYIRAGNHLRK